MARQRTSDLETILRGIEQAGSVETFISEQLRERGFLVERRETDGMSQRELASYKKQLKAEAAERRELRREAWQAYKTKHIVHLGEGVYWNDNDNFDKWDHDSAESRAAENELPPLDKPEQLAELLGITIAQLRLLAFHRDTAKFVHYARFTIPKRDGSERQIWAPRPILKKAQRQILRDILERLPVHGSAHGFLAGRSIQSNAVNHSGAQLVVKLDVKDFFPTITQRRVKGVFRKAGYREQIATLLSLICTESPREVVQHNGESYFVAIGPRCLPQGAPTSPALTNTVCLNMDRRLSGLAKSLGWRYTRYADDMTFSVAAGKKREDDKAVGLTKLLGAAHEIVSTEGFQVHTKKTRILRPGSRQAVTGLVLNGDTAPRVPRNTRRMLRAAIHNLSVGKPLRDGETPATLRGYIAFVASTDLAAAARFTEQLEAALSRK
ncbi:MAG: retron St85 family RNA-directed DNA polymerase [Aureliella sp.]